MKIKHSIKILDDAYISVMALVKSYDDYETINLIKPILNKIDEIQSDIERLNNQS